MTSRPKKIRDKVFTPAVGFRLNIKYMYTFRFKESEIEEIYLVDLPGAYGHAVTCLIKEMLFIQTSS